MIRARATIRGRPTVILGITTDNIAKLTEGMPIVAVDLADVGIPGIDVVITYGATQRRIVADLEEAGLLEAGTAADMPEPQPADVFYLRPAGKEDK